MFGVDVCVGIVGLEDKLSSLSQEVIEAAEKSDGLTGVLREQMLSAVDQLRADSEESVETVARLGECLDWGAGSWGEGPSLPSLIVLVLPQHNEISMPFPPESRMTRTS